VHKLPKAITITTSAPETRVLLLLFCILHVDKAPSVVTFWPDLNLALRKKQKGKPKRKLRSERQKEMASKHKQKWGTTADGLQGTAVSGGRMRSRKGPKRATSGLRESLCRIQLCLLGHFDFAECLCD